MRQSVRIASQLAGLVPLKLLPFIGHLEAACQVIQGRRWGAGSLASEVRSVLQFLPTGGAVVFDVGAHKGQWTRAILELAGDRIERIYAFEPSSTLALGIIRRRLPRTEVVPAAVYDRAGSTALYAPKPDASTASLHARCSYARPFYEQERVAAVTLDEFAAGHRIERIDLLKLDIEGNELAALKGAGRLLSTGRIRAILFEFGSANVDSRTFLLDFWHALSPLGYRFYRVLPGARLLPVPRYHESLDGAGKSYYLAVTSPAQHPASN